MSAVSEPLHAPSAAIDTEWWRGAVVYQIYPRSFRDANGDGVGDLAGITERLDYVASLGVDAVWISPFFKSPMRDFGYDVSDFCDVDPIFGVLADFDALIEKARAVGLRVIVDQVYSHTSDQHAWFAESRTNRTNPKADWYVWADPKPDGTPPNNWRSVFGGPAWTWDSRRKQYYLHNFLASQPDLNLHNAEVQDAVLDVARFWLDRGVDGFRLDAVNFFLHDQALRDNPPAPEDGRPRNRPFDYQAHIYNQSHPDVATILERIRAVTDEYGGVFTVAEIGDPKPQLEMRAYTAGDKRLNSAYGFEFLYAGEITPAFVEKTIAAFADGAADGWPSWAFSNHDAPRAVSRWATEENRDAAARCFALLLACLRGNVFLYQGDELGLPQADVPFERLQDPEAIANWPLTLGRDGARTPMPWTRNAPHAGFSTAADTWLPVDPRHAALSADAQETDPGSVLNAHRSFLKLRAAAPALRTGDIRFLRQSDAVCAFERSSADQTLLCMVNLSETAVDIAAPAGRWRRLAAANLDDGTSSLPLALPPFAGFVAEKT
ncbi:MAG: alpha-glucosidase family protein [Pseudomonadota bacterium]